MPRTVIHVFHDDDDSLLIGTRAALRVQEVAPDHGSTVEVFCFGAAQRRLGAAGSPVDALFNRQVDELVSAGVPVTACVNAARADGTEAELTGRGLRLRVARDEFLRWTLEGATVITF